MNYRSATCLVLITLLLLSLFTALKSFVAVHNVQQWSDDVLLFVMMERTKAGKQAREVESYQTRLDAIQQQWTVMRHVSLASCLLCCVGICLLSLNEKSVPTDAARPVSTG